MRCQVVFSRRPAHATIGHPVIVKAAAIMEFLVGRTDRSLRESRSLRPRGSPYILRLATTLPKPTGCQCRRKSEHQIRFDRVFVARRSITGSFRGVEQRPK